MQKVRLGGVDCTATVYRRRRRSPVIIRRRATKRRLSAWCSRRQLWLPTGVTRPLGQSAFHEHGPVGRGLGRCVRRCYRSCLLWLILITVFGLQIPARLDAGGPGPEIFHNTVDLGAVDGQKQIASTFNEDIIQQTYKFEVNARSQVKIRLRFGDTEKNVVAYLYRTRLVAWQSRGSRVSSP